MTKFTFTVYQRQGTTNVFKPTTVTKVAQSFAEALAQLTATHPEHHIAEHLRGLWSAEPYMQQESR